MERAYPYVVVYFAVVLSACGGGGGASSTNASIAQSPSDNSSASTTTVKPATQPPMSASEPLDDIYKTSWSLGTEEFVLVATEKVIWMAPDIDANCYRLETLDILSSSQSSLVVNLRGVDEQLDFESISDTRATIESSGNLYSASTTTQDFLSFEPTLEPCDSAATPSTIRSGIDLVEVPAMVKVDRSASAMTTTELDWAITFDINNSGKLDSGDISIRLSNVKSPGKTESIVPITDLQGRMVIFSSEEIGHSAVGQVAINSDQNKLSFSVDRNTHPLLSLITENTGVFASAAIICTNPEQDDLWTGATDGPWNWTSIFHKDSFPDPVTDDGQLDIRESRENFAAIYEINGMRDAANDQTGESNWADILGLEVQL